MIVWERPCRRVLFPVLAAIRIAWSVAQPARIVDYPDLVDWHTVLSLVAVFHAYSLPFLIVVTLLTASWLGWAG